MFASRVIVFILKPFSWFKFIYDFLTPLERAVGFDSVLGSGDIGIQIGANRKGSDLFRIARAIGKNGLVIGIEADEKALEELKEVVDENDFGCKFIFINKATFSKKGQAKFLLGREMSWSRLDCIDGSDSWMKPKSITDETKVVEMDTIDNILAEIGTEPKSVSYVNLTINGAEYETLKGMTNLLEKSQHLSITVIAGRQNEGYGEGDIGYIDGKPDYVVISDFLSSYGFKVRFKRFGTNLFGYVIGTKGNKKIFM